MNGACATLDEIRDLFECRAEIARTVELIRRKRATVGYQKPHLVLRERGGRWGVFVLTHREGRYLVSFAYGRLFFSLMAVAGWQKAALPVWEKRTALIEQL